MSRKLVEDSFQLNRVPVIPLWDYLIVPLQGDVTDAQAARLTEDVLNRLRARSHHGLVVDLSGLWMVDSHICAVLANLAASSELMGTRTVISGLSPEVALTLQAMGVELEGVQTALNLEQGLELLGLAPPESSTNDDELLQWALAREDDTERAVAERAPSQARKQAP
jgi:rsbT antagonist protein RsbS